MPKEFQQKVYRVRSGRGGGARGEVSLVRQPREDRRRVEESHKEEATPDFAVAGPSTRTVEEEYQLIKKNRLATRKEVRSLDPSVRKELMVPKSVKQLSRSLLPDAPLRKRARKNSPTRAECRLVLGTPCATPAPKLQAWQMSEHASNEWLEGTKEPRFPSPICSSTALSTISEEPELLVDWTTGQLKNQIASVPPPAASVPKKISSEKASTSFKLKLVNEAVRTGESSDITLTLQELLGDESDDELDVDVDDVTVENDTDTGRMTPTDFTDSLNEDVQKWLQDEDKESDRLFKALIPADQFTFDWSCNHNNFKGQRETFTGNCGSTFPVTDRTKPLDIFLKIFDDDFLDLLVTETNRYASRLLSRHLQRYSRLNFYKNVDKSEMAVFLAILVLQGLVSMSVEKDYWLENGYLTLKYFKDLMSYNRFVVLKRVLHFTDSDSTRLSLTKDAQRLRKIQPVLDIFNKKFSSLYFPRRNICIDESLLKWKGRLSFVQKISTKAAKSGIKSFELCEADIGYLWNFLVYAGKTDEQTDLQTNIQSDELAEGPTDRQSDEPTDRQPDEPTDRQSDEPTGVTLPTGVTSKIVQHLAGPLFHRGHTLVMDNFYNSPLLARYLKSKGTDCYGTLRSNREFVPESLKSVQKHELRPGELLQSFTHDLSVCFWRDTNLVSLISTYHTGLVGGKEKYGRFKYKPQVVLDYNLSMGGVDKKDQLLSSFPMESVRNQVWYKKVFRRLLNCAIMNSYIIFKTHTPHATHRWFRRQLADEIIKAFKPPQLETSILTERLMSASANKLRPILHGNHFIGTGASKYLTCVWCHKSRTKYICKQCDVSLCLQICFEEYHTLRDPHNK